MAFYFRTRFWINWISFCSPGDVFSTHAVNNPDIESEMAMLRNYGPDVPEEILRKLVLAFSELRDLADQGLITYPYSTREVVNMVRHLQVGNRTNDIVRVWQETWKCFLLNDRIIVASTCMCSVLFGWQILSTWWQKCCACTYVHHILRVNINIDHVTKLSLVGWNPTIWEPCKPSVALRI